MAVGGAVGGVVGRGVDLRVGFIVGKLVGLSVGYIVLRNVKVNIKCKHMKKTQLITHKSTCSSLLTVILWAHMSENTMETM